MASPPAPKSRPTSLLADLERLGENLLPGAVPVAQSLPKVIGGIIHFLETGSLEPPVAPIAPAVQSAIEEESAAVSRLSAQVEALTTLVTQQQAAAAATAPAPVAPADPTPAAATPPAPTPPPLPTPTDPPAADPVPVDPA